jgi:hypothetical protein
VPRLSARPWAAWPAGLPQRDQLEAARVGNAAIMDERAGRRSR